jgi:hypothetical protein
MHTLDDKCVNPSLFYLDPATPSRANSFRACNFEGIQFPRASRGRGRPPVKRKLKEVVRRNFIEDDRDDGKSDSLV